MSSVASWTIIGPHFFEESLNDEVYIEIILPQLLENVLSLRINM